MLWVFAILIGTLGFGWCALKESYKEQGRLERDRKIREAVTERDERKASVHDAEVREGEKTLEEVKNTSDRDEKSKKIRSLFER